MAQSDWKAVCGGSQEICYGVKTTGIFCRPSCCKKRCKPENIVVFDSAEAAIASGYRPCRKCCPERADWEGAPKELVKKACAWLEKRYEAPYDLQSLADDMCVDKNYLLRVFKREMGQTPLAYFNRKRCERANSMLRQGQYSIAYIAACVGFKTPAHFTQVYKKTMGVTPSDYRDASKRSAFQTDEVKDI